MKYEIHDMSDSNLPITEELDFVYLLELMQPLYEVPEFAWLPELFVIIGHEKLIDLCKYAGGETLIVPTLSELLQSLQALRWFYKINIQHCDVVSSVPEELRGLYAKIVKVYADT